MGYATQAQLEFAAGGAADYLQLTDWNGDGAVDAEVVSTAIALADAWINSFLRQRYATPIANPSTDLQLLAAREFIYQVKASRRLVAITKEDLDDREARRRELEDYRDGKRRPDEPLPAKSTAVRSAIIQLGGDVTRENLKGQW